MKTKIKLLVLFVMLFSCKKERLPVVQIITDLGVIEVMVFADKAPVTTSNFLDLVDQGAYNNSSFYRVVRMDNQPNNDVKIEVIQGGLLDGRLVDKYKPVIHENTRETGVKHLDGVISMARLEPGTASTEFFICIGDQPELDYGGKRNPDGQGFAAFGKVVKGMDVVRTIQSRENKGQMLKKEVLIKEIVRKK